MDWEVEVAEPEGIVMTFFDQRYEQLLCLDSITCVIDAEAVFADGDNEGLNRLKLRQIALAVTELEESGGMTPHTRIVAIGSNGSLDAQELGNKFDACIAKITNPINSSRPKSSKRFRNFGVVFDPAGNVPKPGDFLSIMHQNVENLKPVFQQQGAEFERVHTIWRHHEN